MPSWNAIVKAIKNIFSGRNRVQPEPQVQPIRPLTTTRRIAWGTETQEPSLTRLENFPDDAPLQSETSSLEDRVSLHSDACLVAPLASSPESSVVTVILHLEPEAEVNKEEERKAKGDDFGIEAHIETIQSTPLKPAVASQKPSMTHKKSISMAQANLVLMFNPVRFTKPDSNHSVSSNLVL